MQERIYKLKLNLVQLLEGLIATFLTGSDESISLEWGLICYF
jgi:hypothetical protein